MDSPNFKLYIPRLLKKINPNFKISGTSLACLNNLVRINIEKIMVAVNQIMLHTSKKTISYKEIINIAKLYFSDDIAKNIITYANQSVVSYENNKKNKNRGSKSSLSGLVLPVTRIQNYMMRLSNASRKSEKSSIVMAAICEYLISEILKASIDIADKNKKIRISTRHIMLAIQSHKDLKVFYNNAVFAGGVVHSNPKKN